MRARLLLFALGALAAPAQAEPLQVVGYAGVLGEWELTGTVTPTGNARSKTFAGVLKVTHIGICTQDGPETRSGQIPGRLTWAAR